MTVTQWQSYIHSLYQGDTETPSSGDDDWNYRLNLLVWAISQWDNEEGILWHELWKQNSEAQSQTTDGSTTQFACPTDFRFIGGFVRLTLNGAHTYYPVIPAEKAELFKNESQKACYITGNKSSGYKLNFMDTPATGQTINYPYYRDFTTPTTGSDVLEMADPWFAIHLVLSKLHESDGEGDRALLALQMAQRSMKNMRVRNTMPAWYQENYVPDRDYELGEGGFGL